VRGERGFTLLEVMIAVAIMAMGIVGALELFTGSLKLAGDAGKQSRAVVLARELVDEELWRDVLDDNSRTDREGEFNFTVTTRPIERELRGRDEQDQGDLHPAAGDFGLWLIEAEVRWDTPTGGKSVRLATARIGKKPE
jgi:prepilin-type N-terminal cleavage/methylation domain-containing protein